MNRRGFLRSILAAGVAPYVCTAAGVLMPVRQLVGWHGLRTFVIAPQPFHSDPYERCGWVGAKGWLNDRQYGSLFRVGSKEWSDDVIHKAKSAAISHLQSLL